jgi:TRAP-type transport system periplasmic protein
MIRSLLAAPMAAPSPQDTAPGTTPGRRAGHTPGWLKACLAAAAVTLALPVPAAESFSYDGPVITLRHSHFAPENHPMIKAVNARWLEMVEKESHGKIKIKTYYGAVLHSAKDGFKATVNDITDITPAYVNYQPGSFHLMHVLDLPFAFPNAAVAAKVAEELYPKYFKKEYETMGVLLANGSANGSYNLFTKRPVLRIEDAKGMKVRSAGGTSSTIIAALGAVPVAVPVTEAYSAFQRGLVDGVLLYNTGGVGYRISELATDVTELGVNNPANAWAFSRKTWDGLPPPVQRFMYNMLRRLSMMYGNEYDRQDALSRQKFVAQGMKIHTPTPQEMARWKAAVEPLWEKFMAENEAAGRPARALVADLRALTKKYEGWTAEQFMQEVTEHPTPGIIDGM